MGVKECLCSFTSYAANAFKMIERRAPAYQVTRGPVVATDVVDGTVATIINPTEAKAIPRNLKFDARTNRWTCDCHRTAAKV